MLPPLGFLDGDVARVCVVLAPPSLRAAESISWPHGCAGQLRHRLPPAFHVPTHGDHNLSPPQALRQSHQSLLEGSLGTSRWLSVRSSDLVCLEDRTVICISSRSPRDTDAVAQGRALRTNCLERTWHQTAPLPSVPSLHPAPARLGLLGVQKMLLWALSPQGRSEAGKGQWIGHL